MIRVAHGDPDAVARWCDWPVNHADLISRKAYLNAHYHTLLERLCRCDGYYDAKLAGYYIWAASCWIGHGLIYPTQRPHLGNPGVGVHAKGQIPHLAHAGKGVQKPYNGNVYAWLRRLSERLRYVRVVCGDWSQVCGGNWQDGSWPTVGMFFDPPYSDKAERDARIYAVDSLQVAYEVRQWCVERGRRENYRIVLAGYYDEHAELLDQG